VVYARLVITVMGTNFLF